MEQAESITDSEAQFQIETVHNEKIFLDDYQPNEDGNIKTTNEVNMDDIVLV